MTERASAGRGLARIFGAPPAKNVAVLDFDTARYAKAWRAMVADEANPDVQKIGTTKEQAR